MADALLGPDRFWLLDGLAFLLLSEQDYESAAPIVTEMTELVATLDDPRAIGACSYKRVLLACSGSDAEEMKRAYADAVESAPDSAWLRVVRYNYACALYRLGKHAKAEREAAALVQEYFKITGLTRAGLFAKNPPEIAAMCSDLHADIDDVKRLADSVDLYAMSRNSQVRSAILERIFSNKLYAVCQAALSVVRTGQDVVDECLTILADPIGALEFVDNALIPSLTKGRSARVLWADPGGARGTVAFERFCRVCCGGSRGRLQEAGPTGRRDRAGAAATRASHQHRGSYSTTTSAERHRQERSMSMWLGSQVQAVPWLVC